MFHVDSGSLKAVRLKTNSDPDSYSASSFPWANPAWLFQCALYQWTGEHKANASTHNQHSNRESQPPSVLFNQRSSAAVSAELKTRMVQPLRRCLGTIPLPSKYRGYVLSHIRHCQVNPRHLALFWQKALLESIPMPPFVSLVLSTQLCTSARGFPS